MALFSTDQTDCYDTGGALVPCEGSGHDGQIRAGRAWPDPRFSVAEDLVTDEMTGLIWPKDAGCGDFPASWKEARELVDEMNRDAAFGREDWRLPLRRELFSLVSHSRINPAVVAAETFDNVFNGYYWTADLSARLSDQAWTVHLGGGRLVRGMKHRDAMVWPVAGPVFPGAGTEASPEEKPDARFHARDGLVTDRNTRLMWLQRPEETGPPVAWDQALEAVKQLNEENFKGHDDWHLPNIRELESLVDLECHSPALPDAARFEAVGDFYWSATTSVYTPSYAWTLYTRDGMVGVGYKPDAEFCVWPVRSAS